MIQLNAIQLMTAIKTCTAMDKPLMIWSSPGIGKSSIVKLVAAEMKAQVVDIRLSMFDSVDLRGIPSRSLAGQTVWSPPAILPVDGNPDFDPSRPVLLFLDEAMQAIPAVQSVAFQLCLDRAVGEHKLIPSTRIIMASNRQTDRGGAHRMATPLANRLIHIELIHNLDAWCQYAWDKALNPLVIAFLRLRPDLMNTFDPAKADVAFGTPRSWETVCDIVSQNLPTDIRYALISGTVGEGNAAELEAFMRVWEDMPDPDAVLMNPASAEVPASPATMFALTAALAQRANKGNFGQICEYAGRIPQEFCMRMVKDCVRRAPEVQTTRAFSQFAVKNKNVWEG